VACCGDFNIAPDDRDVWSPAGLRGRDPRDGARAEASRRGARLGAGRRVPRPYPDDEGLFSYWDYTAGRFHKRQGMRIDYVLASRPLAERPVDVVDRNARKGTKPSDHAPVIAEFDLEVG
jgi:exodeoxyribonuclease III